ncbi:MAG: histidine kinase [Ferruginibacter sp.]|nr:histidine kinase [Ferruginibacter sp.]
MNAGRKKWILLWVTFFGLLACYAQKPVLYFKRLNRANGLSNNKVNCILQDKRGFTWIGTDDGLNRYDGNNFIVFKNIPGQSSSISGNTITGLHEDSEGVMWIATADGGITRYDHRMQPDKKFHQFKHHPGNSNSIPVNIIHAVKEDRNGYLWLATGGKGVLRFDKKKEQFVQLAGIGVWTIYDLCFDKNGLLWAGKEGGSIVQINPKNLQWKTDPRYTNLYAALPHVVVTSLFKDSKDHIWFGSWDKAVYRFNAVTGAEESFVFEKDNPFSFGTDEAIAFNEDNQGRIWIGGKHFGLYMYDPATGKFYNYRYHAAKEGTLSSDRVNCIFIDAAGIVWLGTNNGISIFNAAQQQFEQEFLPSFSQSNGTPLFIYDFLKDKQGVLWIGTNKGLYRKGMDGRYQYKKISFRGSALSITKFYEDDDGTLYLGTDYSLFRYNIASSTVSLLPNTEKDQVMKKLIESRIVSMVKDTIDGHPVLLTAPFGHFLSYYDFTDKRWISRKDSVRKILTRYKIKDNLIRKIIKTSNGHLWLANVKNGLILLNKNGQGNSTYINDPSQQNSISNNNVFDVKEDSKGNLWVSTFGGGLNYFDTRKKAFNHYGSVNNLLEGLEIDKDGNIWSISNGGLQKFDPRTKSFTYAGLPDVEKTGGVNGFIYKDTDGKMYVAGAGYFIAFDPRQIVVQQKQPEVFLTDFSIFDRSFSHLLMKKEIALNHTQNFFTIHFAAPFYSASAPLQYAYMLEGVDKDWINAGTSTLSPYTNLNGGEYTFKVKATATPGTWSDKITTIRIRIIPPFWKTWWFFVIAVVSLAGIGYGLYRYRVNAILKLQAVRNKIGQDLHDSLGSTLSSISIYSQVAKIYNEQQRSLDLKSTLEKISMASGEMISEMADIVWVINPSNDNMAVILQRMESFARPLLATQEVHFHFTYDETIKYLHLEMTKRKNFYLIFKEAVNNAMKYSGCRNLWVNFKQDNHQLILTVRDDGKGFDKAKVKTANTLSGNGLLNIQQRAKDMKGSCVLETEPGRGTTMVLQFPIP